MSSREILLHLSLIDNLGPVAIQAIVQKLNQEFKNIYNFSKIDLVNSFGFSEPIAKRVVEGLENSEILKKELELIDKHAVRILTLIDEEYPSHLKEIYAPPPVLYVKGNVSALKKDSLAVIGSRKANLYGKKIIASLVPDFVQHNFSIVSGGALGADAMAHEATLQAKGITIVVLGSGLTQLYPKTNLALFKRVVENNGALVSAFPMAMQALPGNFPARNRIISGLSKGCIVIQAAQKSGAVITASFALDQGRDVFAVPGAIDDPLSIGCHQLIQQGAGLVNSSKDVLEHYGFSAKEETPKQTNILETIVSNVAAKSLSIEERLLLYCKTSRSIDELMAETSLELAQLQSVLFGLQLEGVISQNFAGLWHTT